MIIRVLKRMVPLKLKQYLHYVRLYNRLSYAKDGLYTIHNCSFITTDEFNKAYVLGRNTGSWGGAEIEWRAHTVLWAAAKAFKLEGDFVECGVNKGGFPRAIMEYLDFGNSSKKFYLLDTFEGFDKELLTEGEKKKYKDVVPYRDSYEYVRKVFEEFKNVILVKGSVPHTLPEVRSEKIAFLSIDMNCVQPEAEALEYFWPKMVSGGVIVLDDFAYRGYEEQNIAHTEWAKTKQIGILTLPTGQGLIIKP